LKKSAERMRKKTLTQPECSGEDCTRSAFL
jgi:hypothetical protein